MTQPATDIAVYQAHGETGEITLTIKDIQEFLCPTATPKEAMTFLKVCQYQGLNPWTGDAYLVVYGTGDNRNVSIITGKDTFTKRAHRHPAFEGFQAGIVVEVKGEVIEREGTLLGAREILLGGWATVYRSDKRLPFKQVCNIKEFNNKRRNWESMPGTMIRKVALVQALREAFPEDLGALYDSSEMGMNISNEGVAEYDGGPVIEAHTTVPTVDENANDEVTSANTSSPEPAQHPNARVSEEQLAKFFAHVKELGVPGQEIQRAFKEEPDLRGIPIMNTRANNYLTTQPWNTNQLQAIQDWMDREYSPQAPVGEEAENFGTTTTETAEAQDGVATTVASAPEQPSDNGTPNEAGGANTPGDSDTGTVTESPEASVANASEEATESLYPTSLPEQFDADTKPDDSEDSETEPDQLPF